MVPASRLLVYWRSACASTCSLHTVGLLLSLLCGIAGQLDRYTAALAVLLLYRLSVYQGSALACLCRLSLLCHCASVAVDVVVRGLALRMRRLRLDVRTDTRFLYRLSIVQLLNRSLLQTRHYLKSDHHSPVISYKSDDYICL